MTTEQAPTTLRDTISAAVETVEASADTTTPIEAVTTSEPKPQAETAPVVNVESKVEAKPDDRPRNPDGTFKPKEEAAATPVAPPAAQVPAAPALPPLQRPSSWKKDLWPVWDKLAQGQALTAQEARQVAEYNLQREGEYAKGVSTYKNEWDRAKPIMDSLAPHIQDFERMGINVAQQLDRYATIHKVLAQGSPEQKLGILMRVAQDYKIPVEQMFVRGQDGQVYLNTQVQPYQFQQPQSQQQPPADVKTLVQQELAQQGAVQETIRFKEAKDSGGNPLHPHFEEVRETMAQLLDAGVVKDIPSAYSMALNAPQHANLADHDRQQREAQAQAEAARKVKEATDLAKRNAVSPRAATPSSAAMAGTQKGLRGTIEEAYDTHATSRV